MSNLKGKKIILAVSGSIAAYKTPQLVRLLIKQGAEVKVILTAAAATMVSPLALSTVSKHPVLQSLSADANWNNHVDLGYWADVLLIAPLSANTMAHLAHGFCNNLLQAVYLSAKCPVVFAPAMDEDMWRHPSVIQNTQTLISRQSHHYIPVGNGELASGLIGEGRMAEPEEIVSYLSDFFENDNLFPIRKKAIVTAGPTYEKIDPVRFIGNFSSGKMGIALAKALVKNGYEVDLITGPGVPLLDAAFVHQHPITTALEMQTKVMEYFPKSDYTIMAAAVADFRPESTADQKIKKGDSATMDIRLVKNPDIIQGLGEIKKEHQVLMGFALETNNGLANAQSKLIKKKADYIALNAMQQEENVFGSENNAITLLCKDGSIQEFPMATKTAIAEKLINFILEKNNIK